MVVSIENLENQSLTSLRKTILFNISSKRKNQNEKTFEEESIEILKILGSISNQSIKIYNHT